jgi:hypothetical protein
MKESEFPDFEFDRLIADLERRGSVPPPRKATSLYDKKADGRASEFLVSQYGRYIRAGAVFQRDIRRLDPGLMEALDYEFKKRRSELRQLLPPVSVQTDRVLETLPNKPTTSSARSQLVKALGVR